MRPHLHGWAFYVGKSQLALEIASPFDFSPEDPVLFALAPSTRCFDRPHGRTGISKNVRVPVFTRRFPALVPHPSSPNLWLPKSPRYTPGSEPSIGTAPTAFE